MHIPCRNYCDCLLFGKSYPKQNIISSDPTKEVVSEWKCRSYPNIVCCPYWDAFHTKSRFMMRFLCEFWGWPWQYIDVYSLTNFQYYFTLTTNQFSILFYLSGDLFALTFKLQPPRYLLAIGYWTYHSPVQTSHFLGCSRHAFLMTISRQHRIMCSEG
jgi:hypothetical protein